MTYNPDSQAGVQVCIQAMTTAHAAVLAPQIAAIDPWHRLRITEPGIRSLLAEAPPFQVNRAIVIEGQPVGAIVVLLDWLKGPYLKHLSVLPAAQGAGAGSAALEWLLALAVQNRQPNVWLCVSGFNQPAQRFYTRHGFEVVGTIDDLVITGETEILMRRLVRI